MTLDEYLEEDRRRDEFNENFYAKHGIQVPDIKQLSDASVESLVFFTDDEPEPEIVYTAREACKALEHEQKCLDYQTPEPWASFLLNGSVMKARMSNYRLRFNEIGGGGKVAEYHVKNEQFVVWR